MSWASHEEAMNKSEFVMKGHVQVKTDNLRASLEQAMYKSWTSHRQVMNKL